MHQLNSSYSLGLYRPYLEPMSGLGQNRTLASIILGGPRAGAGSAVRIYNFYAGLPEPLKTQYLTNLKKNATVFYSGSGNFSRFTLS